MTIGTLKSYDSNITLTSGTPTLFSMAVHPFASTLNAGGLPLSYTGSATPVHFIFTNPNSAQAFAEGYLSVDVAGTTGDVIAAYTRARVSGAANGTGYRGYAVDAYGSTGVLVGVSGYTVISAGSTSTAVMSFDATVIGSAVAYDKRMALRGSNHVLLRGGSLVLATGTPATPNAVTTTHLALSAGNSELFVGGKAEVDGELFMDGNTSISVATITATTYTAAAATVILVDATSAAITVNLPAASGKAGRLYTIKKIDASANTVTIDGNAAETIDGAATVVILLQYAVVRIVCDGANWHIV
jgi:Cu/Ag efflux protein CusF